MERRAFVGGVVAMVATPVAAAGQQPQKLHRVVVIFAASPVSEGSKNPFLDAFRQRLRDLGYVEGHNIAIERRSAEGRMERSGDLVADAVRLNSDVLVTVANPLAQAAMRATRTVPIVMVTSGLPVESGLVSSLTRPGGNVTGQTIDTGPEIEGKRLELFKQAVPRIARVVYTNSKLGWEGEVGSQARMAARALGIELVFVEATATEYLRTALLSVARDPFDGLYCGDRPAVFAVRHMIADFALQRRLPVVSAFREATEAGGLLSYGVSLSELFRGAAVYVDKILKGAKPSDLPIAQPTKFELVINVKTAKALNLTLPPSLLARADHVIE